MGYQPPYPAEFERRAVELYRSTDLTLRAAASDLGVSIESLRAWVKQAEIDEGQKAGLTSDEKGRVASVAGGEPPSGDGA